MLLLKSNKKLKRLMKFYYTKAKFAKYFGKKVAWITSGGPVELLLTMGIIPIYPENHGAICGAQKKGVLFAEEAEKLGYSKDLCSYARVDIGSSILKKSPIGGLPNPSFLLCCNNICATVLKWYEIQARYYNVPLIFLDTPFIYENSNVDLILNYVKRQFENLIEEIEKVSHKKFNEKKFIQVLKLSKDALFLWKEILSFSENIPALFSSFDAFIHMAPIVTLRGTKEVVKYYKELKSELEERKEKKEWAIKEEKFRIVWDNIPIWYKMGYLARTFESYKACFVADTYTTSWTSDYLNLENPLDSMVKAYSMIYLNQNINSKIETILNLIERFKADGFVMHSNRSCKPYSFGQYDIKEEVIKKLGIPTLILEADMTDSRAYSEEQIKTRIQAFMETLSSRS